MSTPFSLEDALAARYEQAKTQYDADPGVPGRYEDMQAAWDTMADAVEEAGHDVDTCPCKSCQIYRAGTAAPEEN